MPSAEVSVSTPPMLLATAMFPIVTAFSVRASTSCPATYPPIVTVALLKPALSTSTTVMAALSTTAPAFSAYATMLALATPGAPVSTV